MKMPKLNLPEVELKTKLVNGTIQVFDKVRKSEISIKIGAKYDLKDAVQAHKDLESRKTSGCVLLMP